MERTKRIFAHNPWLWKLILNGSVLLQKKMKRDAELRRKKGSFALDSFLFYRGFHSDVWRAGEICKRYNIHSLYSLRMWKQWLLVARIWRTMRCMRSRRRKKKSGCGNKGTNDNVSARKNSQGVSRHSAITFAAYVTTKCTGSVIHCVYIKWSSCGCRMRVLKWAPKSFCRSY